MISYDTLYLCPNCETEHPAGDWNLSTQDDFGGNIMPIDVADDVEYEYTCPSCDKVSAIMNIKAIN